MHFFNKNFRQDWPTKLTLLGWIGLGMLGLLSAFRAALWLCYAHVFNTLTAGQVAQAFLYGLWFDISIICLFMAPAAALFLLPLKSKNWARFCLGLLLTAGVVLAGTLTADAVYFPQAKRHMAEELLNVWGEKGFLLRFAFAQCKLALFLLCAGTGAAFWAAYRYLNRHYAPRPYPFYQLLAGWLIAVFILFVGFRGRLHNKPLGLRDIYAISSSPAQATLTFNGAFTAVHTMRKGGALKNPMNETKALLHAQQLLTAPDETIPNPAYPLMRQIKKAGAFKPYNVFVVLLESWTPHYIDSLAGGTYGVTPHFDKIVRQGTVFTHAYAAGVRSIYGLSAALGGVALVPGLPHFSQGLEMNAITSLPQALNERGYYTMFAQSSLRSSYQMCAIASNIFYTQESFGMEDFPRLMPYQKPQDFGYDYDLLQFAADKAAASHQRKQPFFIFTFTGTTHTPFNKTTDQFQKYAGKTEEEHYLNTLYYADYSIGSLLERARQEGWMQNTLFVFMADHTLGTAQKDDEIHQKFRIPFVLYAPEILPAQKIDYTVSQLDFIPTIYHLLQMDSPFTALGKNALNAQGPHFAFITEGGAIALITDDGFVRHTREQLAQSSAAQPEQLAEDVLALDKATTALFSRNAWYQPQK